MLDIVILFIRHSRQVSEFIDHISPILTALHWPLDFSWFTSVTTSAGVSEAERNCPPILPLTVIQTARQNNCAIFRSWKASVKEAFVSPFLLFVSPCPHCVSPSVLLFRKRFHNSTATKISFYTTFVFLHSTKHWHLETKKWRTVRISTLKSVILFFSHLVSVKLKNVLANCS